MSLYFILFYYFFYFAILLAVSGPSVVRAQLVGKFLARVHKRARVKDDRWVLRLRRSFDDAPRRDLHAWVRFQEP
jgi:hypothetical protein